MMPLLAIVLSHTRSFKQEPQRLGQPITGANSCPMSATPVGHSPQRERPEAVVKTLTGG